MSRMMKNIYISAIMAIVFLLTGCVDDGIYYPDGDCPEGETVVSLEAVFKPFTEGNLTRANIENGNGKVLNTIQNLWIVVYDKDGNILGNEYPKRINFSESDVKDESRPDTDRDNPIAETATKSLKNIKLKLPFGNYYIVGVANLKNTLTNEMCATLDDILKLKVNWNNSDISRNGEMIGYFVDSNSENVGWPSANDGFRTVAVNRSGMTLKCWLRRCASKITIDFDGSMLQDKVTVYLKQAKIYDISYDCTLGFGPKSAAFSSESASPSEGGTYNHSPKSKEEKSDGLYHLSTQVISYASNATTDDENSSTSDDYHEWPSISSATPKLMKDGDPINFHAETADALYFYENMQYNNGDPKMSKVPKFDFDKGEMIHVEKDGMPYGSYIEVEGFYISEAEGHVTQGNIKYRFMLGKNVTDNFEAERNYHYMLTLKPKGSGNEADWHIVYQEQVLEVTPMKDVNYMGYFFEPNAAPYQSYANLGHKFNNQNTVKVTSFVTQEDGSKKPVRWNVSYKENGETQFKSEKPDWITMIGGFSENGDSSQDVTFVAGTTTPDEIDIDANLRSNAKGMYNLASSSGATGVIENTANCYIVDGYGTFTLPLVYGNAIKDGTDNKISYDHTDYLHTDKGYPVLGKLKNHLNNDIKSPYIADHEGCTPGNPELVWEDVNGMVTKIVNYDGYGYSPKGNKIGGIQFNINPGSIKQGNAVIAIKDTEGKIMWSWHIWVTNLKAKPTSRNEGLKETIKVTKSINTISWPQRTEFELMSVNLGWCSEDNPVKYYPERSCEIKISSGNMSRTIKFVQKSHMAFPRGNNTYYQWGRKDPFWGLSIKETFEQNKLIDKTVWPNTVADKNNKRPYRFYEDGETADGNDRKTTIALFDKNTTAADNDDFNYANGNRLIQQPSHWHNPPRRRNKGTQESGQDPLNDFDSQNKMYYDLWGQIYQDPFLTWYDYEDYKTVYDPTPVGYVVPHYAPFTSFTTNEDNIEGDNAGGKNHTGIDGTEKFQSAYWFEAALNNIPDYGEQNKFYKNYLMEFYTDDTKLQTIIFPATGYRDWDDQATVRSFGITNVAYGYAWSRQLSKWQFSNDFEVVDITTIIGNITSTVKKYKYPADATYMLEFSRGARPEDLFNTDGHYPDGFGKNVKPRTSFNTCDGMPIRPMKWPPR